MRTGQDGAVSKLKAAEMTGKPDQDHQYGDAPVQAVVSVAARRSRRSPRHRTASRSSGVTTRSTQPADVSKAKQNDRFAVVLKITEAKPEYGHIMVSDYLPAGS